MPSTTSTVTRLGPSWKGLFGSPRTYAKGVLRATADEAYLRESILEPAAKVVSGYERGESGMPSYAGVLNDRQIESRHSLHQRPEIGLLAQSS